LDARSGIIPATPYKVMVRCNLDGGVSRRQEPHYGSGSSELGLVEGTLSRLYFASRFGCRSSDTGARQSQEMTPAS